MDYRQRKKLYGRITELEDLVDQNEKNRKDETLRRLRIEKELSERIKSKRSRALRRKVLEVAGLVAIVSVMIFGLVVIVDA